MNDASLAEQDSRPGQSSVCRTCNKTVPAFQHKRRSFIAAHVSNGVC